VLPAARNRSLTHDWNKNRIGPFCQATPHGSRGMGTLDPYLLFLEMALATALQQQMAS